jgi:hypothetical protein
MNPDYPFSWVCEECALAAGGTMPHNHIAAWHIGKCDACGRKRIVSEPRDFRYPRFAKDIPTRFIQELENQKTDLK